MMMTPVPPLLAGGLLLLTLASPARADAPVGTPLLKSLDLVGYPARTTPPGFSGHTFDARLVAMTELRGTVVLVSFRASWCLECRPEMSQLERLHGEFAPEGLAVVGVNAREDSEAVRRYARALSLTFPLVLDPDGKINAAYGVIGLPTTFVVDRDGRAVTLAAGPREWVGSAQELIKARLVEPAPRPQ